MYKQKALLLENSAWRREGDSNPRWLLATPDFESGTFDHSDTSPQYVFILAQ